MPKIIVFDTETTDLPKERNVSVSVSTLDNWGHIVQLSWVFLDTDIVHPQKQIPPRDYIIKTTEGIESAEKALECHHITREIMNSRGIDIKDALKEFCLEASKADYVVAHNLQFDKTMILVECMRNNMFDAYPFSKTQQIDYCTMLYGCDICKLPFSNGGKKPWGSRSSYKSPKLSELYNCLFRSTTEMNNETNETNTLINGTAPAESYKLHNALTDVILCARCFYAMNYAEDLFELNPEIKNYL